VDGTFALADLPAGDYALHARAGGGAEGMVARASAGGQGVTIALVASAGLDGTLAGFAGTADVWISRLDETGGPAVHATAARGSFRVRGLAPGRHRVAVTAPGGGDIRTVELAPGRVEKVVLENRGLGSVAGRVLDVRTGQPVAGVPCVRGPSLGDGVAWQPLPETRVTGVDGRFAFGPGPAGPTAVECGASGGLHSDGRAQLVVGAGERAEVEVQLVRLPPGFPVDRPGTIPAIGVVLDVLAPAARVLSIVPGSPADRAGMRPGDGVLSVDRWPAHGLTPDGVAALVLDRPPGAHASLVLWREGVTLAVELAVGEPLARLP
jgi:hypothetical protein